MEAKAIAKDIGISPRKMRLVADLVRGKSVEEAMNILKFTPTPGARALAKVVKSAAANAENNRQLTPGGLKVAKLFIDQGHTIHRSRAKSRSHVAPWLRRSSHITVVVEGEA